MGKIIIWSLLLLFWFIDFIRVCAKDADEDKGFFRSGAFFDIILIAFSGIMLVNSKDQLDEKKVFNNIKCGLTYVGVPDDNPFKRDTIQILNLTEYNKKYWVQYKTTDGEIHQSEIGKIKHYFKK